MNDLTEDEILLFTYVSYPKFKSESAVYERVIKRIPVAVSLYNKGKVSLEKAAFLAGLPIEKFLDKVRVDKMKIFDTSSIICILREIRFPKALDTCIKRSYRLTTTRQVYDEIQKNPETFQAFTNYGKFTVIPVNEDP